MGELKWVFLLVGEVDHGQRGRLRRVVGSREIDSGGLCDEGNINTAGIGICNDRVAGGSSGVGA